MVDFPASHVKFFFLWGYAKIIQYPTSTGWCIISDSAIQEVVTWSPWKISTMFVSDYMGEKKSSSQACKLTNTTTFSSPPKQGNWVEPKNNNNTLPETSIDPENRTLKKEISVPTIHFQMRTVRFREGNF